MTGKIHFVTKHIAQNMKSTHPKAEIYDTSSYGDHGKFFSPFTLHEDGIPVPGQDGLISYSVEGIWQGLKVIDGKCDFTLFENKRPHKRKHEPYPETRFIYGQSEIGIIEARHKIYVPSYLYMFEHLVPEDVIDEIMSKAIEGIDQFFHDVDNNPNINDSTRSYAHSSLLVDILERELARRTSL